MPAMQENMPTPPLEEDTWRLDRIPVAWLGNVLAALAFCTLMTCVLQDGRRVKSPPLVGRTAIQSPAPSLDESEERSQVLSLVTTEDTRIDVNSASRAQVESLPGIGEGIAREIIARRPFETVESLNDVPGIGPKRLAKIIPLIKVGKGQPAAVEETR